MKTNEAIELSLEPVDGELLERPGTIADPLGDLVRAAAVLFRVPAEEIRGRERYRSVAAARHCVAWQMRVTWGWSFPEIGRALALDHTTVMSAVSRIRREINRGTDVGAKALALGPLPARRIPGEGVVLELEEVAGR